MGEISKAIYSLKDSGDPLTAKAHIEHALTLNFDATTSNPIKSGIIYKLRRPKIEFLLTITVSVVHGTCFENIL